MTVRRSGVLASLMEKMPSIYDNDNENRRNRTVQDELWQGNECARWQLYNVCLVSSWTYAHVKQIVFTGLKRKLPYWPYGFVLVYRARRLPVPLDQRVWLNTRTVRSPNVPETRRHNGANKPALLHVRP